MFFWKMYVYFSFFYDWRVLLFNEVIVDELCMYVCTPPFSWVEVMIRKLWRTSFPVRKKVNSDLHLDKRGRGENE
jgi:hypothetical protein